MRAAATAVALVMALLLLARGTGAGTATYRAAIAQVAPVSGGSADDVLTESLAMYQGVVRAATDDQAQIVVFPEWGLFGDNGTSSRDAVRPFCETVLNWESNPDGLVANLSAMAAAEQVVVVANVCDEQACTDGLDCPDDGVLLYNTEVVFDETGALVAVYPKTHPFKKRVFDKPPTANVVTFTTSFGVTFGLFICFDIAFPHPQSDLLALGVTHFPYSVDMASMEIISQVTFTAWSVKQQGATLLASNLGLVGSGAFVNGTHLDALPTSGTGYVLVDVPV